jgi:hypothetical protein
MLLSAAAAARLSSVAGRRSLVVVRSMRSISLLSAAGRGSGVGLARRGLSSSAANNLNLNPETVSYLSMNGSEVYLVGTNHTSTSSAEDVKTAFSAVKPEAVMVELCAGHSLSLRASNLRA